MTQPDAIENGDMPDANRLMQWFYWFAEGKGIKAAAYAELKTAAAENPAEPFDCWATDTKQRLFYTGDSADGDGGFITLG
ncbi:MAG: hypothetical protein PHW69_02665 [Elusimicrobiaceae bacterium]|nr:hypothetical protein [Elusimicrobiaceae bacterium]